MPYIYEHMGYGELLIVNASTCEASLSIVLAFGRYIRQVTMFTLAHLFYLF